MPSAWIGLGSNQGQSEITLCSALRALDRLPKTRVLQGSHGYITRPWGVTDQDDFLNAVAQLETALAPETLLDSLLQIEHGLGRVRRAERWGPRTLDLDLLLFDEQIIDTPRLQVPHPRLHLRAFVLVPLNDLASDLTVPGRGTVAELLAQLDSDERADIKRLGPLEYHRIP